MEKHRARRRRIILIFIVIGVAITLAIRIPATRVGRAAEASPRPAAPSIPVAVATVSRADVPVRLSALGAVTAFNTVTVRPRVDGQLMRVAFHEGQFVKQGDLLAQIDPRPFQVQLEQAEGQLSRDQAQLANARVDLTRYQTLWGQDSIARQNVDAQQSTVKQLEAALKVDQGAVDNARLNLTYSRITAPLSGRVGLRLVDVGNVVTASATTGIVVITQVEPIAVVFTLPEDALPTVLPHIREGMKLPVDAFNRAGDTRLASGTVLTVDNQIDQSTGTVRLKAVFDNRDHALWPGQSVSTRLLVATLKDATVIPDDAVQHGPNGLYAYLVNRENKAELRKIKVTRSIDGRSVVDEGLAPGEQVITAGQFKVQPGTLVTTAVASADQAQAKAAGE
jgi:membrane fusion protein, multidrug efflux system